MLAPHDHARTEAIGTFISSEKKDEIDEVVKKAVEKYGEALRLLGRE